MVFARKACRESHVPLLPGSWSALSEPQRLTRFFVHLAPRSFQTCLKKVLTFFKTSSIGSLIIFTRVQVQHSFQQVSSSPGWPQVGLGPEQVRTLPHTFCNVFSVSFKDVVSKKHFQEEVSLKAC